MRTLRIPLILLALVGLIALAGCGGDDETTTSTEATTSTTSTTSTATTATDSTATDVSPDVAEYTQQAQQILLQFGTSFTTLGMQIQQSKDEQEFAGLVDQAESQIQTTIDDFSALQPPEEAQEGHDQILAAFEDFSSKLTDVSDAASSGDKQALQTAAQELQAAGTDFQTQLTEAAQSLADAGVDLQGGAAPSPGG